jgi:arylsulfatase A-like enzyme
MGSKLEWGPNHYGFDSSYGSLAGAIGMYDHRYRLDSPFARTWHRDHEYIEETGHATDLVTAEAVRVIEQQGAAPLLLYVPFQAVHTPLTEEPRWLDLNRHHENTDRMLYAAAVTHMDHCVGKIVEALEEAGKINHTLLVFLSDNGAQVNHSGNGYPPPDPSLKQFSSNKPLRGKKTEVYEGGIRVPAFAYAPGLLEPGVCEAPLHAVDWLPTLAALAGATDALPGSIDGTNVWPAVEGDREACGELAARQLYWVWGDRRRVALRSGDWKLLRNDNNGAWQLFNLAEDPYETNDLAERRPDRVEAMLAQLSDQGRQDSN